MHIFQYIDEHELHVMMEKGYITKREHPLLPISIYNYSKICQCDGIWNDATMKCRGLVVNERTGDILARPFRKFFNYEELEAQNRTDEIPVNLNHTISEKVDGSLGVMFRFGGELFITTKGTLDNEQGAHATGVLREKCKKYPELKDAFKEGYTYLFEIVYPEDHHCISYGELDDIVLIGVINVETGDELSPSEECKRLCDICGELPFPFAHDYGSMNWTNIREMISDKNKEGFVVKFENNFRMKLKYESYWKIHYLRSGLTDRRLIEILEQGGDARKELMKNIEDNLDEENRITVKKRIREFETEFERIKHIAESEYVPFVKLEREEAEYYKKCTYPHLEFAIAKNKDIRHMIWKIVKDGLKGDKMEDVV